MIRFCVICVIFLFLSGCTEVEMAKIGTQEFELSAPSPTPANQPEKALSSVSPSVKLTKKQQKYLDEHLLVSARKVLENATKFEILAEVGEPSLSESDTREFHPNRIITITSDVLKREILEAFYWDAAREGPPAICYEPHHSFRATYQDETVEVEICYSCSRYILKTKSGKIHGTIQREDRRSEELIERIVREQGVELKNE